MIKFIGRKRELDVLEKFWSKDGYDLGVVYGRRRIGKSFLLKHFSEGKRAVMLQATTNEKSNLKDLAFQISKLFSPSASVVYSSYEDAFLDVARLAEKEKLLFIIDEISFLEESNKDILSIIQKYSDIVFQKTQLKLILCSSMESFMVERVIGSKTPLYGRSSLSFALKPIKAEEVSSFFPSWTLDDIASAYVITGGVPYYLMRMAKYRTFKEALREEFFSFGGALLSEPYLLLYSEVRNVESYMGIMALIAEGVNKTSKIAPKAGISQALCSSMLKKLDNLSFVSERKNAVIDSKVLGWKIQDNFLAFWFRFVYPAEKAIDLERGEIFLEEAVKTLNNFVGRRVEETIREYIVNKASKPVKKYGLVEFPNPLERKNEEIDFVAECENGTYLFGEFKWRDRCVDVCVLEDLKRKSLLVLPSHCEREYYLVSKAGFSAALSDIASTDTKVHLISGWDIFVPDGE